MVCPVVGVCGGCEANHSLEKKVQDIYERLGAKLQESALHIYASPDSGYRSRGEFRIYKKAPNIKSTNADSRDLADSFGLDSTSLPKLFLSMSAKSKNTHIPIAHCPILLPALQDVLHALLPLLERVSVLSHKLYAIEVLGSRFSTLGALPPKSSTLESSVLIASHSALLHTIVKDTHQHSDVVISLIYHKHLDLAFEQAALDLLLALRRDLSKSKETQARLGRISLIARSKNERLCITPQGEQIRDYATDVVQVCDKPYTYLRKEGQFCQPNAYMNACMLSFVKHAISSHEREDLLEMYGGDGNFSIALAECFDKVLVTEVVKKASAHIAQNAALNGISNITSVRLSGAETMSALRFEREFFRLKRVDIRAFSFSHILIDPPRSGVGDEAMLAFIAGFSSIIYISCNPASLLKDLQVLLQTHSIENVALFDQFPHTHHLECALILRKQS